MKPRITYVLELTYNNTIIGEIDSLFMSGKKIGDQIIIDMVVVYPIIYLVATS